MKVACLMLSLAAVLAGCEQPQQSQQFNGWAVREAFNREVRQAVLIQQTLFEHHFQPGSRQLSELGMEDVRVLAEHYKVNEGQLSIRTGRANANLYRDRIEQVAQAMKELGVSRERIQFVNRPALGDGVTSLDAIRILSRKGPDFTEDYGKPIITNIVPENGQ